jgi:hypothetical protein
MFKRSIANRYTLALSTDAQVGANFRPDVLRGIRGDHSQSREALPWHLDRSRCASRSAPSVRASAAPPGPTSRGKRGAAREGAKKDLNESEIREVQSAREPRSPSRSFKGSRASRLSDDIDSSVADVLGGATSTLGQVLSQTRSRYQQRRMEIRTK